jgi:hypothetical protein
MIDPFIELADSNPSRTDCASPLVRSPPVGEIGSLVLLATPILLALTWCYRLNWGGSGLIPAPQEERSPAGGRGFSALRLPANQCSLGEGKALATKKR